MGLKYKVLRSMLASVSVCAQALVQCWHYVYTAQRHGMMLCSSHAPIATK